MDLTLVETKIANSKCQRGIANVERESITPDGTLSRGGRESAQSAAPVITDGRYPLKYRTAVKPATLKELIIMLGASSSLNTERH